jgi:uncharacterized protein with HEPN domain
MSETDIRATLEEMLQYAELAHSFTIERTRADLDEDRQLEMAVSHALQLVGEAARSLPANVTDLHPEIPWRKIVGMRNFIVHGYRNLDFDTVWTTASIDTADLIE